MDDREFYSLITSLENNPEENQSIENQEIPKVHESIRERMDKIGDRLKQQGKFRADGLDTLGVTVRTSPQRQHWMDDRD